MFKSSRLSFSKQNNGKQQQQESEKQKQKKRLSFKDPEVDKSSRTANQESEKGAAKKDPLLCPIPTIDDLRLEDQAFQIARDVGFAFVKPDSEQSILKEAPRAITESKQSQQLIFQQRDPQLKIEIPGIRTQVNSETHHPQQKDFLEELCPLDPPTLSMKSPNAEMSSDSPVKNSSSMLADQPGIPTFAQHQIQILHYQLEQQKQQTQMAFQQIQLLKDQLDAEASARNKAQAQTQQVMQHNKELVKHMEKVMQQVQTMEKKLSANEDQNLGINPEAKQLDINPTVPITPRRNSSAHSLWSNSSSTSLYPARRTSSTSFGLTDSKPSSEAKLKDDLPAKYNSPYDSDWRYRRRGSSTISANALPLPCKTTEPTSPTAAPSSRNQRSPFTIPDFKFSNSKEGPPMQDGLTDKKDNIVRDRLSILNHGPRRSVSPVPGTSAEESSAYFRPIQADKSARPTDKGGTNVPPKTIAKSLDSLRLFSS